MTQMNQNRMEKSRTEGKQMKQNNMEPTELELKRITCNRTQNN